MLINRKKSIQNKATGFTIVELIVSIVVIGILASIAVVSYPGIKKQMTISQMNADLRTAATQLKRDFSKNGKYPNVKEDLDDGRGLAVPSGSVFSYTYNSSANTYCMSTTKDSLVYYIDSTSDVITEGVCPSSLTYVKTRNGANYEGTNKSTAKLTADGGVIVVGDTYNIDTSQGDILIIKYNSSGDISWVKSWGTSTCDWSNDVVQTLDGGYVMIGRTQSTDGGGDNEDILVIKFDASGNLVWNKNIGQTSYISDDDSNSLVETKDGSLVMVGYTNLDRFILKLNSLGDVIWSRTYNSYGDNSAIVVSSDGGFVVTGYDTWGSSAYIEKYDQSGNIVWHKDWGGNAIEATKDIISLVDGGYIVSGYTGSYGAGGDDGFVARFDKIGSMLWYRTWGGTGVDRTTSATQAVDGSILITGHTASFGAGSDDMFLAKFDASGSLIWNKTFGSSLPDKGLSVFLAKDNNYWLVGTTGGFGAVASGFFIAKYNPDGIIANCGVSNCMSPTVTLTSPNNVNFTSGNIDTPISGLFQVNPSPSRDFLVPPAISQTIIVP